jgi:hypothetical protein
MYCTHVVLCTAQVAATHGLICTVPMWCYALLKLLLLITSTDTDCCILLLSACVTVLVLLYCDTLYTMLQ